MSLLSNSILSLLLAVGLVSAASADSHKDDLMATDRAFNQMSVDVGTREAFLAFMAEDAILLTDRAQPTFGLAAIAPLLGAENPGALTWTPETAVTSDDGTLGYTWGRYIASGVDGDGNAYEAHGKYVNVWRKNAEGQWRVLVDMGNTNPDPSIPSGE